MHEAFERRAEELRRRIGEAGLDLLLFTDPVSIYFLTGYWGYVDIEFGRPTILCVSRSGEFTLITPKLESEMAHAMSRVGDIRTYADGVGGEWRDPLMGVVGRSGKMSCGIEIAHAPGMVTEYLRGEIGASGLADGSGVLSAMRMIKTAEEIDLLRKAGQVAVAMGAAARDAIAENVPEFEVALAILEGGTRKAAELMAGEDPDSFDSPMIYNLQPLQSGHYTSMPHRRATMRRIRMGDPVFICFCGVANFKHFKPGFDRQYFLGSVSEENTPHLRDRRCRAAGGHRGHGSRSDCRGRPLCGRRAVSAGRYQPAVTPYGPCHRLFRQRDATTQGRRQDDAGAWHGVRRRRGRHAAGEMLRPRLGYDSGDRNGSRVPDRISARTDCSLAEPGLGMPGAFQCGA